MPGDTPTTSTGQDSELIAITTQMQGLGLSTILEQGPSSINNPAGQGEPVSTATVGANFLDEDELGEGWDEKDKKLFGTVCGHLKALQTAVSIPLFEVVHKFDGDPRNFRTWIRELERYSQIAKLSEDELSKIAHLTCSGPVADFIKRFFEENNAKHQKTSWGALRVLLDKRFGDITDAHQALAQLRQIRQGSDEPVQLYGERFLKVAELAYPDAHMHKETKDFIQKQLVDVFCDGLYFDYLRMKVLREQPRTFDAALALAMREQNLRRRFNMRADGDRARDFDRMNWGTFESSMPNTNYWDNVSTLNANTGYRDNAPSANRSSYRDNAPSANRSSYRDNAPSARRSFGGNSTPQWGYTDQDREPNRSRNGLYSDWSNVKNPRVLRNTEPLDTRQVEPMEIDSMRRHLCTQCGGQGHRSKQCPSHRSNWRGPPRRPHNVYGNDVYVAEAKPIKPRVPQRPQIDVPDWVKGAECFICHMIGHLKRNCPQRQVPDRNRVPPYYEKQWIGPRDGYGPQAQNRQGN
jgi:hypothetical protein